MTTGNAGVRLVNGLEKTYNGATNKDGPRGATNTTEGLTRISEIAERG